MATEKEAQNHRAMRFPILNNKKEIFEEEFSQRLARCVHVLDKARKMSRCEQTRDGKMIQTVEAVFSNF